MKSVMTTNELSEIEKILRELFARDVGSAPMDPATPRQEVAAWDSLRHAQLLINVQKRFAFKFSMLEILQCESYKNLLDIIVAKKTS
jgi:acyl carrier protein